MSRLRTIAVISLLFTIVFFVEYTPIGRSVHIPFDLDGFHYPLADYAFTALRSGRFPQWDPTIYSGLPLAGNIQTALFYPPLWITFALQFFHRTLSYQALEDLVFAHVWLAFLLSYLWLRNGKRFHWLAAVLGSGIFAFSGYMLLQLQHFGLVCGYAWLPLGFAGIDDCAKRQSWRPLWKLALASAMCFLAGYPIFWVVFAICMLAYSIGQSNALTSLVRTGCGLAASLLLVAAQLLPAMEVAAGKAPEARYDRVTGIKDLAFYLSYAIPNYFNFRFGTDVHLNLGKEYLYLGAAAFVGLWFLIRYRRFTGSLPETNVLLASFLFLANPFGLAGMVIERSGSLPQIFSAWYFLGGITAAFAVLAARGLDAGITPKALRMSRGIGIAILISACAWAAYLVFLYLHEQSFAIGWRSGLDALIATLLFGGVILVFRSSTGKLRMGAACGAILLAATEYKAFGTCKRFNAAPGRFSVDYSGNCIPGLDAATCDLLRKQPEYRVALDRSGPSPLELRHIGLTTPQGEDPLLPVGYKKLAEESGPFLTNRWFGIAPENQKALRLFGVHYFITAEAGSSYASLRDNPSFRILEPSNQYFKVFELLDANPSFGWEQPHPEQSTTVKSWTPEMRAISAKSPSDGVFRLSEQYDPGWTAKIDGTPVPIERCHEALQCIALPAGEHLVEFAYQSRLLRMGTLISLASLLLLALAIALGK